MNQCDTLTNILTIYIVIFAALIQPLEREIDFILAFRIVQPGHINWINDNQKFICQVGRQSKKRLKDLHTDFGGEFANKMFAEYTSKESVKWEPNQPYTLE